VGVLDEVDDGRVPSPRISKQDISQPTHASGPLFSTGSAPDSDEEDNLRATPTLGDQRRKVSCGCLFAPEYTIKKLLLSPNGL